MFLALSWQINFINETNIKQLMYINIFYLYTYSMRASRISLKRNFPHNGFEQHP